MTALSRMLTTTQPASRSRQLGPTPAARRLPSTTAVNAKIRGPVDHSTGPLICCALGRIRTCNLLIRSQMLYPLSYECLFCFLLLPALSARSRRQEEHYMTAVVL